MGMELDMMEMELDMMEMELNADRQILVGYEVVELIEELLRISSVDTCE
ncbi:MAG: hypothetical protein FWB85_05015 [Chitinispirillia bacterium]|nr:hypothetical protein [Chitinispirillia bacterium]